MTAGKLEWNPAIIPYSVAFAIFFGMAIVFGTFAVSCGPLSFTALVTSYSLILPTFFGLFFLKESLRFSLIPGLILLFLSIYLINRKNETIPVTPRWILYAVLLFIGNGSCSAVQKLQQSVFKGEYKNEFMFLALVLVFTALLILTLLREREELLPCLKCGWWMGLGYGVVNGLCNFLTIVLANRLPASLMFPTISAGGVVATFFVSTLFYKEKLSRQQIIGFAIGAVSVVLLNL